MEMMAQIIAWLNGVMNSVFGLLHGFMSALPAWLSLTIISSLLGVLLLVLFKYTSPQKAIGRVRDRIKAHLLAMKLFKDNIPVVLKSQVRIFVAAIMLLVYSIPPILVMALPFGLILGQLGAWYQARPLEVDSPAVVFVQLSDTDSDLPVVTLDAAEHVTVVTGPVRVPSKHQVYWKLQADAPGTHVLNFRVNGTEVQKSLHAGESMMRMSMKRPSLSIGDQILYPVEKPFGAASTVQSIEIRYPERGAPLTGSGVWVITLFIISMLGAFAVKPFLNVKI